MKKIHRSPLWGAIVLTSLGIGIGLLTLLLSAHSYPALDSELLFRSYFEETPWIVPVNLLMPILLIWLGYFVSGRGWIGYLLGAVPSLGIGLVNYYKISLRSDPLLASDLMLAAEAGGILDQYQLEFTPLMQRIALFILLFFLLTLICVPRLKLALPERLLASASSLALVGVVMVCVFLNGTIEDKMVNDRHINPWSEVEQFVSRGTLYSFLRSVGDMLPQKPQGYNARVAHEFRKLWQKKEIPEEQKVSIVGIMLEAFCDLSDYGKLAEEPGVLELYAPWHELEAQSVHGDLLTNIFAGGTVDSEWGFLTGYTSHDTFRKPTDSYVWYLRQQGYQTFGSHPGHSWFYNRKNVNEYLGFEEYWFTENHYGDLVDPTDAIWNSDHILFPELLKQIQERVKDGPCFSFSVSYQNHGPYETSGYSEEAYVTGLDAESNHIFSNYLYGLKKTMNALFPFIQGLEDMEKPVVLVLFGDHKPWGGNGNSAYTAAGVDFDFSKLTGFYDYYATPYIIWANSSAKETLDQRFVGEGGDFSPCFLMTELFDQCGWQGPEFMQMSRMIRKISPLIHTRGLFLQQGALTDVLSQEEEEMLTAFLSVQYDREHKEDPRNGTISTSRS